MVGIIAVLVSLLLPSLGRAREQARKTQCMSNLKQIGAAVYMYAQENQGLVPPLYFNYVTPIKNGYDATFSFGPVAGYSSTAPTVPGQSVALLVVDGPTGNGANYLQSNDIFFCPGDEYRAPFRDPINRWGPQVQTALGNYNSQSYWLYYRPEKYWSRTTGVRVVENASIIAWKNYKLTVKKPETRMYMTDQYIPRVGTAITDATIMAAYKNFHADGMNVLYIDGHVKWLQGSTFLETARTRNLGQTVAYSDIINYGCNDNY